jgi:hypothetical protein
MGLSHWVLVLGGFEMASFAIFALSIATAVPERRVAPVTATVSSRQSAKIHRRID